MIDKLLLERISLAGICRVCNIGQSWLQRYIKDKYASCPDDLNVDLILPDTDSYLSDRMDEEINRIQVQKKSIALREYIYAYLKMRLLNVF